MMSPKCAVIALCVVIVGSFLSANASVIPLEKDDNEIDFSHLHSDYSSIDIDGLPEESKAYDEVEEEEAMANADEDINNESEVEYVEEIEDEEKHDNEIKESEEEEVETDKDEEEETDKDEEEKEERDSEEDSEESGDEDGDEEVTEKIEDDKTILKTEGKVLFNSGEGKDYVQIVQILDEDDSQKETKSASWYEKIKKYFATKLGL